MQIIQPELSPRNINGAATKVKRDFGGRGISPALVKFFPLDAQMFVSIIE